MGAGHASEAVHDLAVFFHILVAAVPGVTGTGGQQPRVRTSATLVNRREWDNVLADIPVSFRQAVFGLMD
jgi:hypothetical protein